MKMPRKSSNADRVPSAEDLLVEHISIPTGAQVLATSLSAGELRADDLARRLAQRSATTTNGTETDVVAFFGDRFAADVCRQRGGVSVICQANLPKGPFDAIVMPTRKDGDAELLREQIQQAFLALREGGQLWVSSNNPNDHWVGKQIREVFSKCRQPFHDERGVIYRATRVGKLKRERDFSCQSTFRYGDRILTVYSRPGVFAHRRVDNGARAILKTMQVRPGETVLDIGAGSGVLSLAAATQNEGSPVWAIDSNCRAIDCLRRAIDLNGLTNIQCLLSHDGAGLDNVADVCLANPPYYANFAVAERFLEIAQQALRPNGRLYLVTKFPQWYADHLGRWFASGEIHPVGNYHVVVALRPWDPSTHVG